MTLARKAANGWKRSFDEPIPLPRGRQLVTLKDAGRYITKLPKAEHEAAEWQAAMEALILVATSGGPTMFARIGIMRALNRHVERVFNPDRKTIIGDAESWRGIDDARVGPQCFAVLFSSVVPAGTNPTFPRLIPVLLCGAAMNWEAKMFLIGLGALLVLGG